MSDPNVDRWRPSGKVYLWKNKRPRMREWAIMADDAACDALLDLLDRMEGAQWPSRQSLPVLKPTRPPDLGGDWPFRGAAELTISYRKGLVPAEYWLLEERDGGVVLTLGLSRLLELRDAILDMKRGGGDYAIGGDDGRLWIWWHCEQPVNEV